MAKVNPFALLVALILSSLSISILSDIPSLAVLAIVVFLPFLFGINIPKILWSMKVMALTAILIFVFALMADKGLLRSFGDTARFLSVIALSALYVTTADLLEMADTLGSVLYPILGKNGRKAASTIMMAISLFPIIFSTSMEMMNGRKCRQGSFFRHPVSSLSEYVISMMRLLFNKVVTFQDAMYSRLWKPDGERTRVAFRKTDYAVMVMSLLIAIGVFLWTKLL